MIRYMTHWLFGWDYVHLSNSADQIIRRIRYTADGSAYVKYYGSSLIFLDGKEKWKLTPLTYKNL